MLMFVLFLVMIVVLIDYIIIILGRNSATAQRHALEREKKNGYTVVSDGENLHVLEFFAVGNKGKAVLFFFCQG